MFLVLAVYLFLVFILGGMIPSLFRDYPNVGFIILALACIIVLGLILKSIIVYMPIMLWITIGAFIAGIIVDLIIGGKDE